MYKLKLGFLVSLIWLVACSTAGSPADDEAPTVLLASSSTSVTQATGLTLKATVSDNVGVTRVVFYRDGDKLTEVSSAPYTHELALSAADNGTLSFTAEAYDAAGNSSLSQPVSVTVIIDSTPAETCTEPASYVLTFKSTWSAATHPEDFPSSPHFSGLVGATHSGDVSFWQMGELASPGIKSMAETGSKSPLDDEIEAAITAKTAETKLSGGGIGTSPGTVTLEVEVSPEYPEVTLVSMIAPSPDWFVGVSGLALCEEGQWLGSKEIALLPYDAGTDSGASYAAPNSPTNPPEVISALGSPFAVDGEVVSLGTFRFEKMKLITK